MGGFLQAAAGVLVGLILIQLLSARDKSYASMLSIGLCAMILLLGIQYLTPVMDFLRELEALGNLHTELITVLMKAAGIGMVAEIAALLCQDSGNASLAQTLRLLSSLVILWLSMPVFRALLELIQKILEGI